MIDVTPLISDAIAVLAAACIVFITVKLVPELKKLLPSPMAKWLTEREFWEAEIEKAIIGVEKKFPGRGQGDLKLPSAVAYLEKQAKRYGFTFDEYVVDTQLHAKLKEIEEATAAALVKE